MKSNDRRIRVAEARSVKDARWIWFAKPLPTPPIYGMPYIIIFYYYYICHLPYIFDVPKVAFDRINIGPEGRWKGPRNCRNSVCPPYVRLFGPFIAKFAFESGFHARKHWAKSTFFSLRNCRKSVCRPPSVSPSLRDICRIIFLGYVN